MIDPRRSGTATSGPKASTLTTARRWQSGLTTHNERTPFGAVRAHRDARETALEAADVLTALRPHAKVMIRDLQTGADITPQQP